MYSGRMGKKELKISSTTRQIWKKPRIDLVQVFKEFCESTSLHGYSYLYNTNSTILKMSWIIVILFMTGIAIFFSIANTNEYLKSGLVTQIELFTEAELTVIIHAL